MTLTLVVAVVALVVVAGYLYLDNRRLDVQVWKLTAERNAASGSYHALRHEIQDGCSRMTGRPCAVTLPGPKSQAS